MAKITLDNENTGLVYRVHRMDPEWRMFILATIIGVIGGIGAVFFRIIISLMFKILFEIPHSASGRYGNVVVVLSPTIGGLIVGALVYYFSNEARGHGVPEIINSVNLEGGRMRYRVPFVKIFASAFSIGSRGSAGREGPIAQIGGGFGSLLGTYLKLTDEERKTLVISGVSAGIAATFNAPLGGALFGLEVIRRDKKSVSFIPLIVSSVVGTAIGAVFLEGEPAFVFPTELSYHTTFNIPFYLLLGIAMGIMSVAWVKGFYGIEDQFDKLKVHPIILPGIGGFLVGIIELKYPEVSGNTYEPIDMAFALEFSLITLLVLAFIKFLATAFTLGSGGSGGIFAPTLFIGVMLGSAFGILMQELGLTSAPVAVFALLGMAALFAGSSHAPLTAIVMTAEMVGDYKLFVPLMFTVSLSWFVSRRISSDDMYIVKLKRRGVNLNKQEDLLEDITVQNIMVTNIVTVSPKDRLEHVMDIMRDTGHTGFPVEENGKLFGIITEHDVNQALNSNEDLSTWIVSNHCTKKVETVLQECPVSIALIKMVEGNINRFPVIDSKESHNLVGWVTRSDIMKAYRKIKRELAQAKYEIDLFARVESGDLDIKSQN